LATHAGTLAALGGQHVRVAGVGVTPAQEALQLAASTVWLGWSESPSTKLRTGPNWASIGLAQEALVGVRHSSTWLRCAQLQMADRLSKIT
jgi:hypothetical protein